MSSESKTRWYNPETLAIVDQVLGADGKKMITPDARHARKLGLLPSVTSICDQLTNYGVQDYRENAIAKAACSFPFDGNPDHEGSVMTYVEMILSKAGEYAKQAADEGKAIHASVSRFYADGITPENPVHYSVVRAVDAFLLEKGVTEILTEQAIGSAEKRCAGTPDIYGIRPSGIPLILDVKSTDLIKFKKPYESWMVQLGGYRYLEEDQAEIAEAVADRNCGEVKFYEYPDGERWEEVFAMLVKIFCLRKKL